jgi:formate hydrogenlyase transcriptional activator
MRPGFQTRTHLAWSHQALTQNLQSYEKELIESALAESNGKVAGPNGAAAKLGIPRSTLDLKIKQLNIKKYTSQ